MPTIRRFVFTAAMVLGFSGGLAAQPPTTEAATDLPPELQAELDALRTGLWYPSAMWRASLGWRDNVLLSPFVPIERAFGRAEVEAMLWRPMRNRWEFLSFLNGDVLRYFSPPAETSGEQQWSLHLEERWQAAAPLRVALKATGYTHDMVIDLSETEARRIVAPTRVRGGYLTATTLWNLPGGFRFEPLARFKRTDYRDFPGDYAEEIFGARLDWDRGEALVLSVAAFEHRREYAERNQYTAGGRALPGTRLHFTQRAGEFKAGTAWRLGGQWNLTTTVARLQNRDGASGYFDYDHDRARLELGWSNARWRALFDAEATQMEFLVQTVGAGISPPPRRAEDYELNVRVERELNQRWTLFAQHRWERSRSNEAEFSYRVNTTHAGVQCSF